MKRLLYCFAIGYLSRRVVFIDLRTWAFSPKRWNDFFQPITSCEYAENYGNVALFSSKYCLFVLLTKAIFLNLRFFKKEKQTPNQARDSLELFGIRLSTNPSTVLQHFRTILSTSCQSFTTSRSNGSTARLLNTHSKSVMTSANKYHSIRCERKVLLCTSEALIREQKLNCRIRQRTSTLYNCTY